MTDFLSIGYICGILLIGYGSVSGQVNVVFAAALLSTTAAILKIQKAEKPQSNKQESKNEKEESKQQQNPGEQKEHDKLLQENEIEKAKESESEDEIGDAYGDSGTDESEHESFDEDESLYTSAEDDIEIVKIMGNQNYKFKTPTDE